MNACLRCLHHPKVAIGGTMVLCFVLVAAFAPWLAPNDPQAQDLLATLLPPGWQPEGLAQYPLGTDALGRCVLSRLIYGSRIALLVAVSAATGAMLFGSILAILAGYLRGRLDAVLGFIVGLWLSIPPVVFSMLLMVGLGTGVGNVILAVVLVDWTRFYRVVRAEVIVARQREYVQAARLLGFSHVRIMLREILPGVLPLILTSILGNALMAFLGIGVKVATMPVIALGVGIGVDYGIYVYSRLSTFLREGMPLQEAYYQTLKSTGRAVLFTGLCLALGVETWVYSAIKFQADMGLMLTFMFLLNMWGALWLLPALARYLIDPHKIVKQATGRFSLAH